MSTIIVCDKCNSRLTSGWQLSGPLRQINARGALTVVIDRPGDYCSSCLVGVMVTHKMENSRPDIPVMVEEEISLDESLEDRIKMPEETHKFASHAPRPDQTPPPIPPATTISKRKREGLL